MGEKQPVTQGEDLTVTFQDIEDSEYGSLLVARQKIFPTERREIMVTSWISQEKRRFLGKTGRTWSYFIDDDDLKEKGFATIVHMVGVRILRRTQNARVDITDTDYTNQIDEVNEMIDNDILNFQDPETPIDISNVEPDLVDPDSDYDYN
jgi:hypothetical protein